MVWRVLPFLALLTVVAAVAAAAAADPPAVSYTGAAFLGAPGVEFPTTQPSAVGSSAQFGTGSEHEILAFLPLVGPGVFGASAPVTVRIVVDVTHLNEENDPMTLLTDGTRGSVVGASIGDNDGGRVWPGWGTLGATTHSLQFEQPGVPCGCFPGVGVGSTTLDMTLTIVAGIVEVEGTFTGSGAGQGTASFEHTYAVTLDPSLGLDLVLGRDHEYEAYRFNQVGYTVTAGATAAPAVAFGLRFLPAAPNPFNPATRLAFHLPTDGHVRLTIHDVRGREVRRLVDAARPAGLQSVPWNGTDDAGRFVATAVYHARLEAGGAVRTQALTLVK